MYKYKKAVIFWLIFIPSIIGFYAALWLTILAWYPNGLSQTDWVSHIQAFTIVFSLWSLVFLSHGLFVPETFRRYSKLAFTLASAMVVNLLVGVAYFYFQPELTLTPRRFLLVLVGISFCLIMSWFLLVKYLMKNRLLTHLYLFSFNQELGVMEKEIRERDYLGYRVLGHLGESDIEKLDLSRAEVVILPDNLNAKLEVVEKFYKLRSKGVVFYNHREFYEQLLGRVFLPGVDRLWLLQNLNYSKKRFYDLVKAVLDRLFGLIMFLLFIITLPVVWFLNIFSGGSLFFIQERIGQNGKPFRIYKFRTMSGGQGNTWTKEGDERITKVGKWLRKTRVDEFPQFVNLLRGDMSLVGPRPEQVGFMELLNQEVPFFEERHIVKPGITGWAQLNVYAGTIEETKEKLEYDLYYIKNRSFLLDMEIILKTMYDIANLKGK